jgi:Rap1a immunity proteins
MKRILYAITVLGALVPQFPARAMTARELFQNCTQFDLNSARGVYCKAFFIGYARGLYFASEAPKHGLPPVCIPETATPNTVQDAFEKWMREHPEDLNREDRFVVDLAATVAYACKKN